MWTRGPDLDALSEVVRDWLLIGDELISTRKHHADASPCPFPSSNAVPTAPPPLIPASANPPRPKQRSHSTMHTSPCAMKESQASPTNPPRPGRQSNPAGE